MTMRGLVAACAAVWVVGCGVAAGQVDAKLFSDMRWREIGPMRGGRVRALTGVPSQPATFYFGMVNGGVWKTTDAGATWQDVWEGQPTGSIGSIAVAETDPNIVYVASGEGLQRPDLATGDGVYKSIDAGRTWTHLPGLRDGQQIGQVAIDPKDPNKVFVAVTGHPYGPNEERGLYRTLDGGATWKRVLYVNPRTGASEVQIDPQNPRTVYAGMWQRQEAPWENGSWIGSEGGMFRSTDGGETFQKLTGHGLPDDILQVQIAIAPTDSKRVYAEVGTVKGQVLLMRTDDGGENWVHAPVDDARPEARIGGGDVPVPKVDPKDANTVYVATVVTWKSTDAGRTWTGLRGSPGGDDYQNVWINPRNTDIVALASDQGVIVSQNGGHTWTQWYNQPTAAMYHVSTDNAFPYRVCGGQQDSGSACVASRSDDGRITFHDWHPAGIEEYGYAAPDPLDPDVVYGGKVTRYDRRTGQIQNIAPPAGYRALRTEPLQFSPVDPHSLYFASNVLWLTKDQGRNWTAVSPDLSRETWELPATVAGYKDTLAAKPTRRGVIYSLGLSPLDGGRLWAGTDDGLIWTTTNGGAKWDNVTPPALKPFWKVFNMDAGHFDPKTAYAAVNTLRLDDMRPHLFRTHDGGATWVEIDNGIALGSATSTIREDPKQKGLLYAGSETQVWVSFDDGDHWQSLRMNMPASSVRDLQVKDDDLVAGTHGRGFLILDNVTPLRQIAARLAEKSAPVHLYAPQRAMRIRGDMNPPTPWPPEMATGENPPDGAMIDYYVGPQFTGVLMLEVRDAKGEVVTRVRSDDVVPPLDPRYPDPVLWSRAPRVLSTTPGHHRFLWDLRYPAVPGMSTGPSDDEAVPHDTPSVATSPFVLPGAYTVRLTAGGKTQTEPMTVVMDPRVKTSMADLEAQFRTSKSIYDDALRATTSLHEIMVLRAHLGAKGAVSAATGDTIESKLTKIAGAQVEAPRRGGPAGPPNLTALRLQLARMQHTVQAADAAPTTSQVEAYEAIRKPLADLMEQWTVLKATDLKAVNDSLRRRGLPLLSLDTRMIDHAVEDQIEMGDVE